MTNLKEDEIFAIADHFGLDPQLKQLIEEMAELTQAICKYFRFNSDRYLPITEDEMERNLFEELADVTLMLYMELAEKLGIKENEVFKRYMSYMSKLDEEAKND